ncbi:MAG: hypothetical protein IIB62_11805 [Proteobacteria bacterium]|nr:hypothetical protein [Pseudomonadota bacterium]
MTTDLIESLDNFAIFLETEGGLPGGKVMESAMADVTLVRQAIAEVERLRRVLFDLAKDPEAGWYARGVANKSRIRL